MYYIFLGGPGELLLLGTAICLAAWLGSFLLDERRQATDAGILVPDELLPQTPFALAERRPDGVSIQVPPGWKVRRFDRTAKSWDDGTVVATADANEPMALQAGEGALLSCGSLHFAVRETRRPRNLDASWTDEFDPIFAGLLAFGLMLALVLGIVVERTPWDPQQQTVAIPDRFVQVLLEPPAPPLAPRPRAAKQPDTPAEGAPAGAAGKPTNRQRRAKGTRVAVDRAQADRAAANQAGLLAELSQQGAAFVPSGEGWQNATSRFQGGLIGVQGQQQGSWGLRSSGTGLGPGGTGESMNGIATGIGDRGGPGGGPGGISSGRARSQGPSVDTQELISIGGLDKAQIDRVVKARLSSFRYCYQRALQQQPDLAGKVTVKFVVAADGSVSRSQIRFTSLQSPAVEACLTEQFRRLRFPAPRGGGRVIVSYPFVFHPGL